MNFLAHDFLSFGVPGIIVGNYLGDFVRNSEVQSLPEDVQNGITIHRKIDSYTDQHPTVKIGTKLLHPSMGKYAPVVLDIYFDYLLTKRWADFSNVSLAQYCLKSYDSLLAYSPLLTDKIALRIRKMTTNRWLENYGTYQGLQRVFNFLSHRRQSRWMAERSNAMLAV